MCGEQVYKPNEFAKMLGVTVKTLQRWDTSGKLKAYRSPSNRRYYTHEQYLDLKGIKQEKEKKENVIYVRVSTKSQSDDLENQVDFLTIFCNARGMIVSRVIREFGSGLNYNRSQWNELLEDVMDRKIKVIVIAHKDRFVRFGYDWFEHFCHKFGTEILVVNNEKASPKEEIVQDILSILQVFRDRLYGLEKYQKQIERDEKLIKNL